MEHSPSHPAPRAPSHTHTHTLTHSHATHGNTKSVPRSEHPGLKCALAAAASLQKSPSCPYPPRGRRGGGEEKQQEEESSGCARERRRKGKGPNLWHFPSGAGAPAGRSAGSLPPPPAARAGRTPGLSVRLSSLIPLGVLGVPWGAAVPERTSSQLLFPAETESA